MPAKHRKATRTSNPVERLFVEVGRRTKIMGSFTNAGSIDRITFGVFWIINTMLEGTRLEHFTQNS